MIDKETLAQWRETATERNYMDVLALLDALEAAEARAEKAERERDEAKAYWNDALTRENRAQKQIIDCQEQLDSIKQTACDCIYELSGTRLGGGDTPVEFLCETVKAQKRALDEAREGSKYLTCSFCGHKAEKPADWNGARSAMAEHIMECEKHPLRIAGLKCAELEQQLAAAEARADESSKGHVKLIEEMQELCEGLGCPAGMNRTAFLRYKFADLEQQLAVANEALQSLAETRSLVCFNLSTDQVLSGWLAEAAAQLEKE